MTETFLVLFFPRNRCPKTRGSVYQKNEEDIEMGLKPLQIWKRRWSPEKWSLSLMVRESAGTMTETPVPKGDLAWGGGAGRAGR